METKRVITIARQFGSGGLEIGRKLAEEFSVPFYDRKTIAEIARDSGADISAFENAPEKARGDELYSILMTDYLFDGGNPVWKGRRVSRDVFLLQKQILEQTCQKGPCVIVGRCADELLRGTAEVFSVFVSADEFSRMDRIIKNYGVPVQNAAEQMIVTDRQRSDYYGYCTDKKWGEPDHYSLSVDSSDYGIDATAELIAKTVRARDGQSGESVS